MITHENMLELDDILEPVFKWCYTHMTPEQKLVISFDGTEIESTDISKDCGFISKKTMYLQDWAK